MTVSIMRKLKNSRLGRTAKELLALVLGFPLFAANDVEPPMVETSEDEVQLLQLGMLLEVLEPSSRSVATKSNQQVGSVGVEYEVVAGDWGAITQ